MEATNLETPPENGVEIVPVTITENAPDLVGTNLFGMYGAGFKRDIRELSKGDLQRLVRALCFDGMEAPEFGNNFSPALPAIISLGKALIEAKFIMSMNAAMAAQAAAQTAQESAVDSADQPETAVTTATETEGSANGEANS